MSTAETAEHWLNEIYRGHVVLASPKPVHQTDTTAVYACSYPPGLGSSSKDSVLTGAVAVPHGGSDPYHLATDDPWGDLAATESDPTLAAPARRVRRTNARGAVVVTHAGVNRARATARPWKPSDELAGWWSRLLRWFPSADTAVVGTWDEVIVEARRRGPDTRGVIWIRRIHGGAEITGHLIYLHNDGGNVVFLDGQRGSLARLETEGIHQLRAALFFEPRPDAANAVWPAEDGVGDYASAVAKAESWLRQTYDDEVTLVRPSPDDEGIQGWVFPCNTRSFLETGDWRSAMIDAAIAVPRSAGEPVLVPNTAPAEWIAKWKDGAAAGRDIAPPPEPAEALWLPGALAAIGSSMLEHVECADFPTALRVLDDLPLESRALVWLRRHDQMGREISGELLVGLHAPAGVTVIDPRSGTPALPRLDADQIHVIRYC